MEFNLLPVEIQLEIFAYLRAPEVMKIRLVCKQWNHLINGQFKFKRLSCNESSHLVEYDFNFTSIRAFLDYTSTDVKFSMVRCLNAELNPDYDQLDDAFQFLNSFRSLEELKFSCFLPFQWRNEEIQKKTLVLSLHRLKKTDIWFSGVFESKVSLVLNLPSLLHLALPSLKNVTIAYPGKVRTLVVSDGFSEEDLDCSQFTSLSKIYSNEHDKYSISASFIERLPSLKELHFDIEFLGIRNLEDHLLEQATEAILRIFYFGFEFDLNQIEAELFPFTFCAQVEDSTEFIARNLHRSIDNNSFVDTIRYNPIARALDDAKMFGVMLKKFPNIRHLHIIGAVADENRLLRFINQFKIKHLEFESTSLSQAFFKKLPKYGPFINWLEIRSEPTMDIQSGHFDFIFNLKLLTELEFNCYTLPLNFTARLLRELKSIKNVRFHSPRVYLFSLRLQGCIREIDLRVYEPRFLRFTHKMPTKQTSEMLDLVSRKLKADSPVCLSELLVLLRHLELEEETHRFMMRKYIYDHTHSICLSKEQMRLLNLSR